MVYSFLINRDDLIPLFKERKLRMTGAISALVTDDLINVNDMKDEVEVGIDERCSDAVEWQTLLSGLKKEEKGKVLTEHFLEQFNAKVPA